MTTPGTPSLFNLQGRVALVTGAASGIGSATARMLAQAGADVSCGWFAGDPYDVNTTVAAIAQTGRRSIAVEGDVATADGANALVEATVRELGRIDIVVANAGIARTVPFADLDEERWRSVIEVNLGGVYRCFRAALPHMVAAGWGRLLATSSTAGYLQGWADHVHYTTAKGGVTGLIRSLAVEVARQGVTVNAVAPGIIPTPQSADPVNSLGDEGLDAAGALIPIGRTGTVEEIAAAFVFLASEEASYVTGQTLVVDGGALVRSPFEVPELPPGVVPGRGA